MIATSINYGVTIFQEYLLLDVLMSELWEKSENAIFYNATEDPWIENEYKTQAIYPRLSCMVFR